MRLNRASFVQPGKATLSKPIKSPLLTDDENGDDETGDVPVCVPECQPDNPDIATAPEINLATPELVEAALEGMNTAGATQLLEQYGFNEIPQKEVKLLDILYRQFSSSMAIMIELAIVLAAAVEEWLDFSIIMTLLLVNASIGFYEEYEALMKVQAIKSQLAAMSSTKRDGEFSKIPTRNLVTGDVIFLRGGDAVPADCDYLSGDMMQVDTSSLTGESLPRKVPDAKGNTRALSGCTVVSGNTYCVVQKTGMATEMGESALLIQGAVKPTQSVFEMRVIRVCEQVMAVALVFVLAIIGVEVERGHSLIEIMVLSLGILIASVPVALPVVMQVTLALGASQMAEYKAIVTHLTAMQEIASMDVLCSDKTGTLTTAKMSVFHDQIWCAPGFTRDEVLTYAALASNADNEDDPIDVAVLRSYAATFNAGGAGEGAAEGEAARRLKAFAVSKFVGFSPETKRVVAYAARDDGVNIKVGKGYVPVVLATPEDDGGEVWTCKDAEALREPVETADEAFGTRGYKTLGVAFAKETEPGSGEYEMEYCGVVPMLDPPREDTAPVIQQIRGLGVAVKMVTGDHRNIASETCRQIGLRDDILARASLIDGADGLWDDLENKTVNPERATMVEKADGFAGVMPKDKNLVVRALKQKGYIVGMTGDGVNDAPALQEAHIGIAVEGATDAARNASDIVLTEEGLSPIATAIIESRKIFQRVRSYVLYRVSATIMIVFVLSMLIFIYDQEIDSLYIILLALLNDLTMITIAYDNVVPSSRPEVTDINQIIAVSFAFGMLESLQVLTFYILAPVVGLTSSWFRGPSDSAESYTEAMMYLLISLSIEMLIFLTRVGKERFYASKPIASLLGSVLFANLLVTVIVLTGMIGTPVGIGDVLVVWAWMSVWFLIIDVIKAPMMTKLEAWLQPSPVAPNPARAPGEGGFGGIELCGYDVGFQFVSDSRAVGSQGADSFRACFGVGSSSAHVDPSSPPPPSA